LVVLDGEALAQEPHREGILAAVDEVFALGGEPDERPSVAVEVVERTRTAIERL